jgi:hypothetical protein
MPSPEEVERLRRNVEGADSTYAAGEAFRALFTKLKRDRLRPLMDDKNTGIALQAAWEVHKKVVKRKPPILGRTNWVFAEKEMEEFVQFLTKRTGTPPPAWWSGAMVRGEVFPGSHHAFIEKPKGGPVHATAKVEKDKVVVSLGERSIEVSKAVCDKELKEIMATGLDDARIAVSLEKEHSFVAIYPLRGYPYQLSCLNSKTGNALWTAEVWACRTGISTGPPDFGHQVEIRRNGNAILLYGEEMGMYLEAFDAKAGKSLYRFCTNYWSQYSEKWDLDGK